VKELTEQDAYKAQAEVVGPVGNLYIQSEKKDGFCEACGSARLMLGYSEKHKAWLCRDHFNHHNTEEMIFQRKQSIGEFTDEDRADVDKTTAGILRETPEPTIVGGPPFHLAKDWGFKPQHDNDEIVTNEQGGKQSKLEYAFELMPPEALKRVAHVLYTGKLKYGANNWQNIPDAKEHLGRAMYHITQAIEGRDHSEDHMANAICRLMFAVWCEDTNHRSAYKTYHDQYFGNPSEKSDV
jgi:hypothetical protein